MRSIEAQFLVHSIPFFLKGPICLNSFGKYYFENHCPTSYPNRPTHHIFTYYIVGVCPKTSIPWMGVNVFMEFPRPVCFVQNPKVIFDNYSTDKDFYIFFDSRQAAVNYTTISFSPLARIIGIPITNGDPVVDPLK
jgi:hypothetical protein